MVSRIVTLKALSKLTGVDDLSMFHLVVVVNAGDLFLNPPPTFSAGLKVATLSRPTVMIDKATGEPVRDTPDTDDGKHGGGEGKSSGDDSLGDLITTPGVRECYLVCSRSDMYLLDIAKVRAKSHQEMLDEERKRKLEIQSVTSVADGKAVLGELRTDTKATKASAGSRRIPGLILRVPLTEVGKIWTHKILADRFAFEFTSQWANARAKPTFLAMSSCHRKRLIEDIQIAHDTAMMSFKSKLQAVRTQPLPMAVPSHWPEFRHPTIMMFNTIPEPLKVGMKPFYRCGYLFLAPRDMQDESSSRHNRHSSTYVFPSFDAAGVEDSPDRSKHLVMRVMPSKPLRASMPDSNLNFHLWVESIAWKVAREEAGPSSRVFIPERGVYHKKMNITSDESMYHCFRLHIYTARREIGVIGIRRKFIPPLLDEYQDMVFVLKGRSNNDIGEVKTEVKFMETIERLVDSLSPSAMDWRRDSYWAQEFRQPPPEPHPTYIDRFVIQQQADALLCNHDMYSWLKNRRRFQIKPSMKFNGKYCYLLAQQFCASACKAAHGGDVKGLPTNTVQDPINIVKRFEASAEVMLKKQRLSPKIKAVLLNNWRKRVSQYFAHVVDCFMPEKFSILKLAKLAAEKTRLNEQNQLVCDKVIAFLLYMHQRGGVYQQPSKSVLEQLTNPDIMARMECNEVVLLKLLAANYFESLSMGRDSGHLTVLLSNLLYRKSNNLEICRAVSRKIRRKNQHDITQLIEPLLILAHMGNAYAKAYAFQALISIVQVNKEAEKICKLGGVDYAIDAIEKSPSRELIQAAVNFLEVIVKKGNKYHFEGKISQVHFLERLMNLLSVQMLKLRHDASLLSSVATLIMRLCSMNPQVLFFFVIGGIIDELVSIIKDYKDYYKILIPISACLGTICYQLEKSKAAFPKLIQDPQSALNEKLTVHTQSLVMTLKRMMNPEGLHVSLNILIVLKYIVRLVGKGREDVLLDDLIHNYAFEHVLSRCKEVANRCEDMNESRGRSSADRSMWNTVIGGVRSASAYLLNEVDRLIDMEDSGSTTTLESKSTVYS